MDCRKICCEFQEVRSNHQYREANRAADFLARQQESPLVKGMLCCSFYHPFGELNDILFQDLDGATYASVGFFIKLCVRPWLLIEELHLYLPKQEKWEG